MLSHNQCVTQSVEGTAGFIRRVSSEGTVTQVFLSEMCISLTVPTRGRKCGRRQTPFPSGKSEPQCG